MQMKCKHCGNNVTADMMFCGECGCPVRNETIGVHCPQCGSTINAADMFCGECGYRLEMQEKETVSIISEKTIAEEKIIAASEYAERTKGIGVKSTLPSRAENSADTTIYSEGKKFLKIASDFE